MAPSEFTRHHNGRRDGRHCGRIRSGIRFAIYAAITAVIVAIITDALGCTCQATGERDTIRSMPPTTVHAAALANPEHTPSCTRTHSRQLELAEASGATLVHTGNTEFLLVISDSGGRGSAMELNVADGSVRRTLQLPLDRRASDDIEGLSAVGPLIYGITSGGWMRTWRLANPETTTADNGPRYQLIAPAYPLVHPRQQSQPRFVCHSPWDSNCGRNYEGLCLHPRPQPSDPCLGYALSKHDGVLYCLVAGDKDETSDSTRNPPRLTIDPSRAIRAGIGEILSGCHFDPSGETIWIGANLLGVNLVYQVTNWRDPTRTAIQAVASMGTSFEEAIAITRDGGIYRFSDTSGAISLAERYQCEKVGYGDHF